MQRAQNANPRQPACFDSLEARAMLSVARDAAGWTVVTPASDTQVIYVSNSQGSDSNTGLSQTAPVKTLAKAQSLVRAGFADWLLLKRGDTFEAFGTWKKSGRSATEPIYISAYGTGDRPEIDSGVSAGFGTAASNGRTDNLVISSLSFFANTYNGANGAGDTGGFRLTAPGSNITIEDCKIQGYKDNITLGDSSNNPAHAVTDVTIRRNEILDSYDTVNPTTTHSQGIYIDGETQRITIEENVFDHNGWRQGTPSDRTFYNHNIYAAAGATGLVVQNNIDTEASFYGAKLNGGGTVTGNLFAQNSVSIYLENAATIQNNVITEAVSMPTQDYGWGIDTYKANSGTIDHNLITKMASTGTTNMLGIKLNDITDTTGSYHFTGSVTNNIIYNWKNTGIDASTKGNGAASVTIQNNQIQMAAASGPVAMSQSSTASQSTFIYGGNMYSATGQSNANKITNTRQSLSAWKTATGEINATYGVGSYPDPTRDIERYSASIGGAGTFADFIAQARNMDKLNWNPAYTAAAVNAWLWQGFGTDTTAPIVSNVTFGDDAQPMTLDVKFSEDVIGSIFTTAMIVKNAATNSIVPFVFSSYNASTLTARYTFSGTLPDGNYTATVVPGIVKDLVGNLQTASYSQDFSFQMADATHDGVVNALDFNLIATNFGKTGQTFSQGDFNFDGRVDAADFSLLSQNFGKALRAQPVSAPAMSSLFGTQSVSDFDSSLLGTPAPA